MTPEEDRHLSRQARIAALVIAATMVLWLGAQWLGGQLSLPYRYAFLFDFAALAALAWSLVVTFRVWQRRRND